MWRSNLISLLFFCSSVRCVETYNEVPSPQEWDFIVFIQQWLPTNCQEYKEIDSSNVCVFSNKPDAWVVHGIWPNRMRGNHPSNCNKTWQLQPGDIASIQDELDNTWPDIFKETLTLWSYEWSKHGTCFVDLPSFSSPLKYFQQVLKWREKYDFPSILEKAGIVPSNNKTYKSDDFETAIERSLGKKSKLRCSWHDTKQYISQIRLCFTKEKELIDCAFVERASLKRQQRAVEDGFPTGRKTVYHTKLRSTVRCDPAMDLFYPIH